MSHALSTLHVARFEHIVLVTRGRDQLALSHREAAELAFHLSHAVGAPEPRSAIPPSIAALRAYLDGKARAQGTLAILRHLRRCGFPDARDSTHLESLLTSAVEQGWVRQTGSGRFALP